MDTLRVMCTAKLQHQNGFDITLEPVQAGSTENNVFYQGTPTGGISLGVLDEETAKSYEVGSEYVVNITKVEE